jgi:PDZ domain-containing protein
MKWNKRTWITLGLLGLILSSLYIPIPYYITQPGQAIALTPMIEVEQGHKENITGSFRITTIRIGSTTVAGFAYALVAPYVDVVKAETVHSPYETDEEYTLRQIEIMKSSQDTAKLVAFERAGYPVEVNNQGAVVMQLIPDFPARQALQVGDVITGVDSKPVRTATELIEALKGRKAGDIVKITYLRGEQRQTAELTLQPLPVTTQEGEPKPGIGIASPMTKREFSLPREVEIKAEHIGGPSAGLMFTLEIINQLVPRDLTKGYNIAGTGTINEDGNVGRIGGIEHKIVAAAKEGVEIFFAPDNVPAHSDYPSNYEQATNMAKQLNTPMTIVPVRTIDEALAYLEQLPSK